MLRIARTALALFAFAAIGASVAPAQAACSGNFCNGLITRLRAEDGNIMLIDPDGTSVPSCTMNGPYVNLDISTPGGIEIWRTLLAAYLAGKSVSIRVYQGANAQCQVAYVTLPTL